MSSTPKAWTLSGGLRIELRADGTVHIKTPPDGVTWAPTYYAAVRAAFNELLHHWRR